MKAMVFKTIAIAATLFGICGTSPMFAADYTFRFAHVLMEDTPNAKAAAWFAKEVEEKSGGRVAVKVLPAGQLGGDVEIIEQIQANLVQIGIPPTATLGNFEPRLQILDLPYILPSQTMMIKVLDGPVGRKILDLLDKHGLYGVNFWGAGFRHMTNGKRKIEGAGDLKGIKMRTMQSPVILAQYREWGASPTAMAFAEVYNGLQQGVIDGQENPLANIGAMRFYEVQKHLTLTSHAYHGYATVVSKDAWKALPPDLKDIMTKALHRARDYARELTIDDEKRILDLVKKTTTVTELTPEKQKEFIALSLPIHKKLEGTVSRELIQAVYEVTGAGK